MTVSRNTTAIAAIALILSSSVAFAQATAPSTGGADTKSTDTGRMNGGAEGNMKPGMKSDGMKSGMSKDGMKDGMKSGGMKPDDGMADKKM